MSDKKTVKPWDMFNRNVQRALPIIAEKRLQICKECPRFVKLTHQCKECACIMNAKVKLEDAECPLNKWKAVNVPFDREITDEDLENL